MQQRLWAKGRGRGRCSAWRPREGALGGWAGLEADFDDVEGGDDEARDAAGEGAGGRLDGGADGHVLRGCGGAGRRGVGMAPGEGVRG